jgi:putative salt-induced outer membrane protein YdiY
MMIRCCMKDLAVLFFAVSFFFSALAFSQEKNPEASGKAPKKKWSGSSAVGYTQSGGNTNASSASLDLEVMRNGVWRDMAWKAGANYGYTRYTDKDIVTTNNNFALYKLDWFMRRTKKQYIFGQVGYTGDEFQGFWAKYNAEAGFGYSWFGDKKPVLKTELGYSYMGWHYVEENDEGDLWETTHNALARISYSQKVSEWLKLAEDAVYYRNLEDGEKYQAESITSATFTITKKLGYKTSFTMKYNNRPLMVEEKDRYGVTVKDDDGEPVLERAEQQDYIWTNMLVITFL